MPFVPAPNIVQIEWRMSLFGQNIENRLMIDNFTTPSEAAITAFGIAAWNWWQNTYAPFVTNDVGLREVVTTDMGQQNGFQAVYAPSTTVTGEVITVGLPNETAFCLSLRSHFRGRSARGRWFVAGIPESYRQDANTLTEVAAENYRGALQNYVNLFAAGPPKPVIVSYRSGGIPRPGGPVYFIIENVTVVDLVLDSQRRRKPGVGT